MHDVDGNSWMLRRRKTPGIDVTKRVLAAIERDRMDKIAALRLEHETRVESAANAVAKKWKEDVQAAIKQRVPPPKMPADAIDPGLFVAPPSVSYPMQRSNALRCCCRRESAACSSSPTSWQHCS